MSELERDGKPGPGMQRQASVAAAFLLLLGTAPISAQLHIQEVHWGFDGRSVPSTFAPVNLLLANPGGHDRAFEGEITLEQELFSGGRVGGRMVEPVPLVGPGQQRWVTFYVYVSGPGLGGNWRVRWNGTMAGGFSIPSPRRGRPARVLMFDPDDVNPPQINAPRFPDMLFPHTVTATDGLAAVILSHAPDWQPTQQQAFLEWLRRGGRVHLLHGRAGSYPRFTQSLGVLNRGAEEQRVGAGLVFRHPVLIAEVDNDFLEKLDGGQWSRRREEPERATMAWRPDKTIGDRAFFSRFRPMTRPDHNWYLIWGLSLVYWLLLFPGGLVLGIKRVDYRIILGALVATIAVFSAAMSFVGARGYGETATVHCAAVAHHVGDGTWDVSAWSDLFVTVGGTYDVAHGGDGQLYAAVSFGSGPTESGGSIPARIQSGLDGRVEVEIPPYTNRSLVHRLRIKGPDFRVERASWNRDQPPQNIEIVLVGEIPDPVLEAWVVHENMLYRLSVAAGDAGRSCRLEFLRPAGSVASFAVAAAKMPRQGMWAFEREDKSVRQLYQELHQPLVIRGLGLDDVDRAATFSIDDDRLRLLILASLPDNLKVQTGQMAGRSHDGIVLYSLDVFQGDAP